MVAYLSVKAGPEAGRKFQLDPDRPMYIGRGASCDIMLTDPVSSRFHAVLFHEDGHWQIRDNRSRNGTTVNGQKTDHATLMHGNVLRVGGTEMQFAELVDDGFVEGPPTQTIVQDRLVTDRGGHDLAPSDPLREAAQGGNLLDLYQLSIQLLRSGEPEEVIETTAALLKSRTDADAIGFFRLNSAGRATVDHVFPSEAAEKLSPDRSLAKRLVQRGEALWVCRDEDATKQESTDHRGASDAIYVPLFDADQIVGALVLRREHGKFDLTAFEFAIASARLIAAALVNTRQNHSLRAERQRLAERNAEADELIGNSPSIVRLKERISRIGRANGCVLIRGESGAGKELVARALHRASPRRDRPMLSVNCAAIPRDLMESQLFGHRKGAFTGADSDHIGWFQQAHTGTLFLDEVGELTLEGQAKLLRILEGHPFLPVGGAEQIRVDVRVIAATNRDLAEFVREKMFREDLYYRLSVFELIVPPLRERGEDIALLIDHFLDHFRRHHGRPQIQFSEEARQRLLGYSWPGNVRQLRNVIDSAIVMAEDETIQVDDLGLRDAGRQDADTLRLDYWEEKLIRKAIDRADGSVPEAAKLLGLSRATLYRKISDYNILR